MGLVLAVVVHPADIQDRDGARAVLEGLKGAFSRLRLVWADSGYAGALAIWLWNQREQRRVRLDIVRRPSGLKGFKVLPRRWVVERTFGWLNRFRRLSKDYELLTDTSEAMVLVAMIGLMTRRLATRS